ncbi:Spherulation-specific family 4 [Aspergillus pseudodeflectus]|uniref:Spherulation-specific family 4 n=1 Tax=Aspergillus pseudodeflectus TaxID=176178 RepID=A0ABR4L712_9EURO
MPPKAAVVVPLYIYPLTSETWAPLYTAIEQNPALTFLVIVNPNSGPGEPDQASPDHNYAREVPRLNAYANVYTVGYIRIDYCRKPLNEACDEIARYAGWAADYEATKLGVRGIFVDETPNHESEERVEYLERLTRFIKECERILGDKFVIHNPGTAPSPSIAATAEMTFICEEPYSRYRSDEVQKWLELHPFERTRAGFMLSGVPNEELHGLVQELRHRSAYIFVTEVVDDFYESFGERSWGAFMRALQHGDGEESGEQHGEQDGEQVASARPLP